MGITFDDVEAVIGPVTESAETAEAPPPGESNATIDIENIESTLKRLQRRQLRLVAD